MLWFISKIDWILILSGALGLGMMNGNPFLTGLGIVVGLFFALWGLISIGPKMHENSLSSSIKFFSSHNDLMESKVAYCIYWAIVMYSFGFFLVGLLFSFFL